MRACVRVCSICLGRVIAPSSLQTTAAFPRSSATTECHASPQFDAPLGRKKRSNPPPPVAATTSTATEAFLRIRKTSAHRNRPHRPTAMPTRPARCCSGSATEARGPQRSPLPRAPPAPGAQRSRPGLHRQPPCHHASARTGRYPLRCPRAKRGCERQPAFSCRRSRARGTEAPHSDCSTPTRTLPAAGRSPCR